MRLLACFCAVLPVFAADLRPFTADDALDVSNTSIAAITRDGRFAAVTVASLRDRIGIDNHRFGDPTYIAPNKMDVRVFDLQSGASRTLFPDRAQVRGLKWSPDGAKLAMMVLHGDVFQARVWDRFSGKFTDVKVPAGKAVDDSGEFFWSADSAKLLVALHSSDWRAKAAAKFKAQTEGPVIFQSSKEPFLSWIDIRRMSMDRSLAWVDVANGSATETAAPAMISSYRAAPDASLLLVNEDIARKTEYETLGAGEARIDVLQAGTRRTLIPSTKDLNPIWSRDLRSYAYTKQGAVYFATIDDKEARLVAGVKKDPAKKDEEKDDKKADTFTASSVSPKGDHLIASNKEGLWIIDTASGAKELMVRMPEEDKLATRYQVIDWSPSGDSVYLSEASRTKWERGIARYSIANRKLETLILDARIYSATHLSEDGRHWVYLAAESNRPAQLFTADESFKGERKLLNANPQLDSIALGKAELVSYLDADGKKLNAVVYLPVNYEPGRKYPAIFNLYEQFFDDTFNATNSVLTANGYAVVQPSVEFDTGFPGEAWLKGVTAAANKVIEMGIADPERLGVQGTSYGGYATNLLITQTNRFKAAVNISGKVDMISFYTDSPRLGVRNIHAPEHSQDRLGATLWQQPQKYVAHSSIFYADRIKTPLLLMCGEADHNVPPRQLMEMYYALRRLGKEVAWVQYVNGGHGMPTTTVEEVRDYHRRLLDWYDQHLKTEAKAQPEHTTQPQ
jgi:dipeptidyl aminopeptidase/acylaminoacyl peptidase